MSRAKHEQLVKEGFYSSQSSSSRNRWEDQDNYGGKRPDVKKRTAQYVASLASLTTVSVKKAKSNAADHTEIIDLTAKSNATDHTDIIDLT